MYIRTKTVWDARKTSTKKKHEFYYLVWKERKADKWVYRDKFIGAKLTLESLERVMTGKKSKKTALELLERYVNRQNKQS